MNEMTDEKTIIKIYLDELAKTDELFAAKYANEKKSIDECWKYITGEMYALVSAGKHGRAVCKAVTHDTVFSLAKHYYEEEDIQITDFSAAAKITTANSKTESKPKAEKKPKVEPKPKAMELNLFDF